MLKQNKATAMLSLLRRLINMNTSKIEINGRVFIPVDEALGDIEQEITLGRMMRSLRKCEDLTLSELAEKLDVKKQFLSAVEHGRKHVGIEFIKQFSRIVDTPANSLLEIYFRDMLRKHGLDLQVMVKNAS
jgi:DNA-binding XRE family transcriptional regulator